MPELDVVKYFLLPNRTCISGTLHMKMISMTQGLIFQFFLLAADAIDVYRLYNGASGHISVLFINFSES